MMRVLQHILIVALSLASMAAIRVENLKDGETLHYPVALLVGACDGDAELRVVNRSNDRTDGKNVTQAKHGQFKVLVELKAGANQIELSSGGQKSSITLNYEPSTNDRRVNIVYMTAEDGDTTYLAQDPKRKQDYVGRLDTMAKLLQTATAEMMFRRGHGRKTFTLDFDDSGKVVVHTMKLPVAKDVLRTKNDHQLYDLIKKEIFPKFPPAKNNTIVIMSFSGYDAMTKKPLAHAALGGRGQGIFSCNGMEAWPISIGDVQRAFTDTTPVDTSKLWDDSVGRSVFWGLASTTMGAVLHEAGHTFGLPHPEPYSRRDIMSRGFDHVNRLYLVEEAPSGRNDKPLKITDDMLTEWHVEHSRWLSTNPFFQPQPLRSESFLKQWRVMENSRPWTSRPKAPQLSDEEIQKIVAELKSRTVEPTPGDDALAMSASLTDRYERRYNAITYALSTVRANEATKVKLLASGDDGFRVWINGKPVMDHSGVEASDIDRYSTDVELKQGENTILVESQQGPGDWGFSVRLVDENDQPLVPDEQGVLKKL